MHTLNLIPQHFRIKLFQMISWVSPLQFDNSAAKAIFFCLENVTFFVNGLFWSTDLRAFLTRVSLNSIFIGLFRVQICISCSNSSFAEENSARSFSFQTTHFLNRRFSFFSLRSKTCYIFFSVFLSRAKFSIILGLFTEEKFPIINCW